MRQRQRVPRSSSRLRRKKRQLAQSADIGWRSTRRRRQPRLSSFVTFAAQAAAAAAAAVLADCFAGTPNARVVLSCACRASERGGPIDRPADSHKRPGRFADESYAKRAAPAPRAAAQRGKAAATCCLRGALVEGASANDSDSDDELLGLVRERETSRKIRDFTAKGLPPTPLEPPTGARVLTD